MLEEERMRMIEEGGSREAAGPIERYCTLMLLPCEAVEARKIAAG